MVYKITAEYTDYTHPVNSNSGPFHPYTSVTHTEYRADATIAKVEVFKYVLGKAELNRGRIAPNGKSTIIPDFEVRNAGQWFSLSNKYYGRGDGNSSVTDHYSVQIQEVDELPAGETLTEGDFVFDESYDNLPPERDTASITDWKVGKFVRLPFRENFDLVKVNLYTPSGRETAFVNCELKDGIFRLRELQDCPVNVTEPLWTQIQRAWPSWERSWTRAA